MTDRKGVFHSDVTPLLEGQQRLKLLAKQTVACTRSESTRFTSHRQGENGWLAYRPASDRQMQSLSYGIDMIGLRT